MLTINHFVTASPEQWGIIIEGMRNPMNSWDKTDSYEYMDYYECNFHLGDNDHDLMQKLSQAGSDHRKFMRMIPVWVTITAPLYWWKEFDQYKVGTTTNSCSTMHKIHAKDFTLDDFSHDRLNDWHKAFLEVLVKRLNADRDCFIKTKDKHYWDQMIQLLPSSYNQRRTVFTNYETLHNIYHARRNHKLTEWHTLCEWIEQLPYSELITS